jgi:DNA-binding NarL/FixJ family response regulator
MTISQRRDDGREAEMQATATLYRRRPGIPNTPPSLPQPVPIATVRQAPSTGLLTPEEHGLLLLLAEGLPLDAIARRLSTSSRTLRRRIRVLCDRIGVQTPLQAAVWAARRGLI